LSYGPLDVGGLATVVGETVAGTVVATGAVLGGVVTIVGGVVTTGGSVVGATYLVFGV